MTSLSLSEKIMVYVGASLGVGTGIYFTQAILTRRSKNVKEIILSEGEKILNLNPAKDSEEYKKWEKLINKLYKDYKSNLESFLEIKVSQPIGYEKTIEQLTKKCENTLKQTWNNEDYKNAKLFCTEHNENWFEKSSVN